MARQRLQSSNAEPGQLLARRPTLDRRWTTLTSVLGASLGLSREEVQVDPSYHDRGVTAGLVGRACERIARNRGGYSRVAPLQRLSDEFLAWIGLQEEWVSVPGTMPFAFKQLSLTVHFGSAGDPIKPQAFRAEWAGLADWGSGAGVGFQSPGAGHPHWQFDALETLRFDPDAIEFEPEPQELVESFEHEVTPIDVLLRSVTLERMHFASVAPWWMAAPGTAAVHAHAPADEGSLTKWTAGCIAYLKQELSRCELH